MKKLLLTLTLLANIGSLLGVADALPVIKEKIRVATDVFLDKYSSRKMTGPERVMFIKRLSSGFALEKFIFHAHTLEEEPFKKSICGALCLIVNVPNITTVPDWFCEALQSSPISYVSFKACMNLDSVTRSRILKAWKAGGKNQQSIIWPETTIAIDDKFYSCCAALRGLQQLQHHQMFVEMQILGSKNLMVSG
jgi:hypothetical protein